MSTKDENLEEMLGITMDDLLDEDLTPEEADHCIADITREIKNTPINPHDELDKQEVERYNVRKKEIAEFKDRLETVKDMQNKDWAQQVLKNNTHNLLVAQMVALKEIEEDPMSKKFTSLSEVSNAITSSAKTMMDIDNDDDNIKLAKEKNILRRMEVESKLNILDANSLQSQGGIGQGSTDDMLSLLESEDTTDE